MPRYLCYCPDYPDALEKRLSVRPTHLAAAKIDLDSGVQIMGAPYLPRPGSAARAKELPEGTPNLAGSFMIYRYDSMEECWARLKADVYYTAGVWDKEAMVVEELLG